MKTVEDSPQRLILRDRTAWIGVACFVAAAFMVGMGLHQGAKPASILVPAALLALFGVAFLSTSTVVIDRARRVIEIRRFTSFRSTRQILGFDEVKDVVIDQSIADRTITCRLALVTAKGNVPLTNVYAPTLARYEAMRIAVLRALGHSTAAAEPYDPVRDLVRQGRSVDAISLLRQREDLDLGTAQARVEAMEKELG